MPRASLSAIYESLIAAGCAPVVLVRPAWPGGGHVGALRKLTFEGPNGASGVLYVTESGRITAGEVVLPGVTGPQQVRNTAEAYYAVRTLPRVAAVTSQ